MDTFVLFVLQLLQFFSLDYYVMIVFRGTWYSRYPNMGFLVSNLALTMLFFHTFISSLKELKRKKTGNRVELNSKYPVHFSCVTWGVYVTVLFSKIVLIFSNQVVLLVSYDDFMGPQMLKVDNEHCLCTYCFVINVFFPPFSVTYWDFRYHFLSNGECRMCG